MPNYCSLLLVGFEDSETLKVREKYINISIKQEKNIYI